MITPENFIASCCYYHNVFSWTNDITQQKLPAIIWNQPASLFTNLMSFATRIINFLSLSFTQPCKIPPQHLYHQSPLQSRKTTCTEAKYRTTRCVGIEVVNRHQNDTPNYNNTEEYVSERARQHALSVERTSRWTINSVWADEDGHEKLPIDWVKLQH